MLFTTSSSKRDLLELASLGDFLRESSSTMGFYKARKGAENIQKNGTTKSEDRSASEDDGREDFCLRRIEDEIGILKDSFCFARRAFDSFYKSNVA